MLAFITTLRHPQNSADYHRVEAFLEETLASIARQTCDDYVVIVVCNQQLTSPLPPRTHVVVVDFPPPTAHAGPQTGMGPFIWDKGSKVGVGLVLARELGADFVMLFDADDYLHRGIAAHVRAHPGSLGWVVRRGWIYSRARNSYALRHRLFRICGTSFIVPFQAYGLPDHLTTASTQAEIVEAFGDDMTEQILAGHRYALEWWRDRGRTLDPLPFAAVCYHVDTGENHSGVRLLGPGLPYRSHLFDDFGIRPGKGAVATLWSAIGPAALRPDVRFRRPFFLKPRKPELTRPAADLNQPAEPPH